MQKRQSARALQQHIKKLLEHLTTTELRTVLRQARRLTKPRAKIVEQLSRQRDKR